MPDAKTPRKPQRGRAFGLIVASTVAAAPSLGCDKTTILPPPHDAAATETASDVASDLAQDMVAMTAEGGTDAVDDGVALDGAVDAQDDDAVDAYPDGVRG